MLIAFVAGVAVLLLLVIAVFQARLAAGAPWGAYAWGGQNPGVLPTKFRVASGISVVLYLAVVLVPLGAAGWISWTPPTWLLWALTAFFVLGVLANGASRSKAERAIWTPITAVLAVCFLLLALQA
jgi:hypothetical protein